MTGTVPELLAPAGTPEALAAACAAGTDAVYIGGPRFGARAAAGFDEAALEAAIDYAHARDVEVYVTVNTLVSERELDLAAEELARCHELGADAVLVQDVGVAALARELVPRLPLHASTQMTIHSAEGVRAAADLGCTRVVLARELPLAEVEAIAHAVPGVELEVFAHGALCYAWSGQCLLSSVIGGRSGNRGRCAQPCRKPYRLLRGTADAWGRITDAVPVDLPERYLLSPRDLWTYPDLRRLAAAPVAALKIEGRLRSPSYVATVVGCYRRALDRIAEGTFTPRDDEEEALRLAFNRGFTRGRLFSESGERFMGRDRPGPRGVRVGIVVRSTPDGRAVVRLEDGVRLGSGDGLAVVPRGSPDMDVGTVFREPAGTGTIALALGRAVPAGAPVHLTSRRVPAAFPSSARLRVDLRVRFEDDRPVADGTVVRRRGSPVRFTFGGEPWAAARSRPLAASAVEEHLRRTGGTAFTFGSIEVAIPGNLFAPASVLNEFRRGILAAAEAALVEAGRPPVTERETARALLARLEQLHGAPSPPLEVDPRVRCLVDSVDAAERAARAGAGEVCLEVRASLEGPCACLPRGPEGVAAELTDAIARCPAPVLWAWPTVTRAAFLNAAGRILAGVGVAGVIVNGLGAARAAREAAPGVPIHGGPGLNVWNSRAIRRLEGAFASLTLSPELSRTELAEAIAASRAAGATVPFAFPVQGNLEVMVADDCLPSLDSCPGASPLRFALEDARGRRFMVRQDGECRTRIQNAVETCLIDRLPALAAAGVDVLVVDGRGRSPAWVAEAVGAYRAGVSALSLPAAERDACLAAQKERFRDISAGGITAGPFQRGRREGQTLLPGPEHDTPCHRRSS